MIQPATRRYGTSNPEVEGARLVSTSVRHAERSRLARLHERRKIDLDAPVQTYVPEFPRKPQPITVRQLAGRTSGIRHYTGAGFGKRLPVGASLLDGLALFKDDPLLHGGMMEGCRAFLLLDAGTGLAIAMLANAQATFAEREALALLDSVGSKVRSKAGNRPSALRTDPSRLLPS
jgi:hypothetical protein